MFGCDGYFLLPQKLTTKDRDKYFILYFKLDEIPPATKIDQKITLWCHQFQLANGVETLRVLAGLYKKDGNRK